LDVPFRNLWLIRNTLLSELLRRSQSIGKSLVYFPSTKNSVTSLHNEIWAIVVRLQSTRVLLSIILLRWREGFGTKVICLCCDYARSQKDQKELHFPVVVSFQFQRGCRIHKISFGKAEIYQPLTRESEIHPLILFHSSNYGKWLLRNSNNRFM
jgi:hypothetical protein